MFVLLEIENEENVLVCLRVIIELHKQFRPQYSPDVRIYSIVTVLHNYVHACMAYKKSLTIIFHTTNIAISWYLVACDIERRYYMPSVLEYRTKNI